MDFSREQLDQLQQYAECLTPISDIAVLMGVSSFELRSAIADEQSIISTTYRRAKAQTALRIRRNELELADAGSPLAVQLVSSYVQDMNTDEDL